MKNCPFKLFSSITLVSFLSLSSITYASTTVSLGKGSYSTYPKGQQVYSAEAGLVDRTTELAWLPLRSVEGNLYATDHLKGAIPTTDWATSFLWGTMYGGITNPYSQPAYAFPLAYQASEEGMYVTSPPVHLVKQASGALDYCQPLQPGYIDLAIKPSAFIPKNALVDAITDWSYDIIMASGSSQMKTTMTQGSPYAFFEFTNTDMEVNFKRGTRMQIIPSLTDDKTLVFKVLDNKENDWNYYALFASTGVTWTYDSHAEFITQIKASFNNHSGYCSLAILPDDTKETLSLFKRYGYNYITNTTTTWSYDESKSKLQTSYCITTTQKPESTTTGTLLGLLPHHWKNLSSHFSDSFAPFTYSTVRGPMKILTGSTYTTELSYSGVLPWMPEVATKDQPMLKSYLDIYLQETQNNPIPYLHIAEGQKAGIGDTYWTGKALNKLVQVIPIAEALGENETATKLTHTLRTVLEDWFSTSDTEQDAFFYYNQEVGTLIGYPSSYGTDTQLNDHHFHYGYWINAAAQIALRDPEWAKDSEWGGMIKELISDIASTDRSQSRYPYLRSFSPYEGHSWASGHQLFADGNNQESSSEALHAWAGLILLGEATHDTQLRDLGIYLYTTEISSLENYWFDLDKDILAPQYRYQDEASLEFVEDKKEIQNQASMVWGGKYVYATWWTAEPLQVQGINLLPLTAASFYLAKDPNYILDNYNLAREKEDQYNGSDKLAVPYDRWNDIWHEYLALSDPKKALQNWNPSAASENGESLAHTYHYLKSLDYWGTPNLTITSSNPLASAFTKNGKTSYSAFNAQDTTQIVSFSDGATLTVAPHTLYTGVNGSGNASALPNPTPSATSSHSSSPSPSPLLGDVDKSGNIDILDALLLKKYLLGFNLNIDLTLSDLNGDGEVNIMDSIKLKKLLLNTL